MRKQPLRRRLSNAWAEAPSPVRMMVILFIGIAVMLLAGCASEPKAVPGRAAIPIECREPMPERPVMPTEHLTPDVTLDGYVAAAEAEIHRREAYEDQLRTALDSCRKPVMP
jgi:starvation-inducible outer membrane lipoprotein